MELNKENIKKIIGIITFSIVLFFIMQNIDFMKNAFLGFIDIISPFLVGIGLAFVLNIPMSFFERKLFKDKRLKNGKIKKNKLKRPICIILSLIIIFLIISFVIKLVIPQLIRIIFMFISNIPNLATDIQAWILDLTKQYPDISEQIKIINIDWNSIVNDLLNMITSFSKNLVTSSIGFITSLIGGIFDTIVAVVFAIYMLNGKEQLLEQIQKIINAYLPEKKAENLFKICRLSKNTFQNFITGQFTEAVILGSLCFIGMILLRLPFAATISILMGVTALIPIVGAFIGAIVGAILILSVSPINSVIFIIFIIVLQQIESNGIYPKVVGDSVGLPGMWVLFAVIVGGGIGGMLGLLLGLPTASVLYAILRSDVNKKLKERIKFEIEKTHS